MKSKICNFIFRSILFGVILFSPFICYGLTITNGSMVFEVVEPNVVSIKQIQNDIIGVSIPAEFDYEGVHYVVQYVGNSAFKDCSQIREVNLPNTIKRIEDFAFWGCIVLPNLHLEHCTSLSYIGKGAFEDCISLSEITIPNSVETIGENAFIDCKSLISMHLPDGTRTINRSAFNGCSALREISLGNSLSAIEDFTFKGCESLQSISLPSSVTSIGGGAFFNCSTLHEIHIKGSITKIGVDAFYNCTSLNKVNISDLESWFNIEFLSAIPSSFGLYLNDNVINELLIPVSISEVKPFCLNGCNSIESIDCNMTQTLGQSCFANCPNLHTITFGPKTQFINNSAILNCSNLSLINCYATIPPTLNGYFGFWSGSDIYTKTVLHVQTGYKTAYSDNEYWKHFSTILDDLSDYSASLENVIIDNELVYYDGSNIIAPIGSFIFDIKGNSWLPYNLPTGIYIVKTPKNLTYKIIIK